MKNAAAPLLIDPRTSADLRRAVLDGWFAGILPDLNQDDPEVARYLIQNSLWWVGMTGLDAIRQDTVPYVPATFWHAWTAALVREYPRLRIVGEVMEDAPPVVAAFQRDMHSLFDYPLYRAVRQAFLDYGFESEEASLAYAQLEDLTRRLSLSATIAPRKSCCAASRRAWC